MKKLPLILVIALVFIGAKVKGQEQVIYDQYHFNYYLINPAVAGADKCSHFMLTTKSNWVGYDGPQTQSLSFRTRLNSKPVGIGGYIFNDQTPNFQDVGAQLSFAYHIPMSNGARYMKNVELDRQLSFGVSAKIHQASYESHNTSDPADVSFSELVPNANIGVYYVDYGFFAGLSATNIIPFEMVNYGLQEPPAPLTVFFFTGYGFKVDQDAKVEPSVNFHATDEGNKQLELNLKYTTNNPVSNVGFWTQLSYRHNLDEGSGQPLSLIPMVGVRLNKFQLAYAFNLSLSEVVKYNYGTHELMLAYSFCIPREFCR